MLLQELLQINEVKKTTPKSINFLDTVEDFIWDVDANDSPLKGIGIKNEGAHVTSGPAYYLSDKSSQAKKFFNEVLVDPKKYFLILAYEAGGGGAGPRYFVITPKSGLTTISRRTIEFSNFDDDEDKNLEFINKLIKRSNIELQPKDFKIGVTKGLTIDALKQYQGGCVIVKNNGKNIIFSIDAD